jgi:hypothetical protein
VEQNPYHAVICSGLSAEIHGLVADTFVDDAIWKHGLPRDAEDEGAEASVAAWLAPGPHGFDRVKQLVEMTNATLFLIITDGAHCS